MYQRVCYFSFYLIILVGNPINMNFEYNEPVCVSPDQYRDFSKYLEESDKDIIRKAADV